MNAWGLETSYAKSTRRKPGLPGVSERVSVDRGGSLAEGVRGLVSSIRWLSALFPFAIYEVMDNLFMTQPYFEKFEADTLALGNSGHEIEIDAPTEQKAQQALQVANDFAARVSRDGGADGLFNGLLSQVCRSGGLCVEFPPEPDMSGVKRGYLVRVSSCRWQYNADGEKELGQLQQGRFVPLNPVQTAYYTAKTYDENPYPLPPALAALSATVSNQKFEEGLRAWTKKVGAFGLLQATAERPEMLQEGETDSAYEARTKRILQEFTKSIAANMTEGVAAAWDNVQFKFTNTNAGAAGAKDMAQMILQGMFAGLLRDPVFFGFNWGTTQTFATVVYRIMAAQVRNYQRCVKRAYEHGLRLELALKGMADIGVSVQFDLTDTLDEFLSSEAAMMERGQYSNEYLDGISSLEECREKLGYDDSSAKSGAFVASFVKQGGLYLMRPPKKRWNGLALPDGRGGFETRPRSDDSTTGGVRRGGTEPSPRPSPRGRGSAIALANDARDARNAARMYVWQVGSHLSDAGHIGVQAVYEWARTHDVPEEDVFVAEALRRFTEGAETSIDGPMLEGIAKEHLTKIWTWARFEDDATFGPDWDRGSRGAGVIFGQADRTAIDYMSRVDRFYTSKYVSGDDVLNQKISNFLRRQYLEKGLGRGASPKELNAFREEFGQFAEDIGTHRARVIIDTGVSRAQNWGEIFSLHDLEITTFRIAGPWDRLTCDWCYAMQGKEFSVVKDRERIQDIISSGEEDISKFGKFITSRFSGKLGLEELRSATAEEIQASGMASAPLHPLCRHRTLAVITTASGNAYRIYEYAPVLVGALRYGMAA